MNIAVDAMGGDDAPKLIVQGALEASQDLGVDITLVGDSESISVELEGKDKTERVRLHHCQETVLMDESPLKAVRNKRDSSIRVAFDLVKKGKADAVVSAGNSGATIAAAIITLGKFEGIERPALACVMPGDKGKVILIDAGGNVDCRPVHLLQFGIMADAFAVACLGMQRPRVGILNVGLEAGKGNKRVRLAYNLLEKSPLNFVGSVEGRDIFSGRVQVVVCDGFIGNVALKLSEGLAESVASRLKERLKGSLTGRVLALFGRNFFKRFMETLDCAEYGGALILGIRGVGIVCHGNASAMAVKNAVKMAVDYVENQSQERLAGLMRDVGHDYLGQTG
jgi:glycerol-3-phosphate acyltransferase PlsX